MTTNKGGQWDKQRNQAKALRNGKGKKTSASNQGGGSIGGGTSA